MVNKLVDLKPIAHEGTEHGTGYQRDRLQCVTCPVRIFPCEPIEQIVVEGLAGGMSTGEDGGRIEGKRQDAHGSTEDEEAAGEVTLASHWTGGESFHHVKCKDLTPD